MSVEEKQNMQPKPHRKRKCGEILGSLTIMKEGTTSGKVKSIAKRLQIARHKFVQLLRQRIREIRALLAPRLPELFLASGIVLGNLDV